MVRALKLDRETIIVNGIPYETSDFEIDYGSSNLPSQPISLWEKVANAKMSLCYLCRRGNIGSKKLEVIGRVKDLFYITGNTEEEFIYKGRIMQQLINEDIEINELDNVLIIKVT